MDSLFFYTSKVLWGFVSPSNFIIFLLFFGTLALIFNGKRIAKIFLIPAALLGSVIMVYPVGDYLIQPLENRFSKPIQMPNSIDGIIVLGGGEDLKRSLSWQTAELGMGADRYIAAADLARTYPRSPIIFTGGSGSIELQDTGKEASIALETLTAIGINKNRILLESDSRNTYENFINILAVLPERNGQYLLVTSAFHMPRAVGVARKFGVNVIAYPVDYRSNSAEMRYFEFDLFDHLKSLEPAWKEWIGLSAYYISEKTSAWFPAPKNQLNPPDILPVQPVQSSPPDLK